LRDYFFVEDMVVPLIRAMSIPADNNNIFNLGGRNAYTLRDLISNIEHTLNMKVRVNFEPARNFDVPDLNLDCSRAKSKIGWQPDTGLEEGILITEQWIRERMN
jgi:nucleoside-diphosphate-sugar epimerase